MGKVIKGLGIDYEGTYINKDELLKKLDSSKQTQTQMISIIKRMDRVVDKNPHCHYCVMESAYRFMEEELQKIKGKDYCGIQEHNKFLQVKWEKERKKYV
jgi:hypothetical protein|tara:strand:- start:1692 stop:1991 length:300 start_codon:yes stop_codon:yes gene_type:complete